MATTTDELIQAAAALREANDDLINALRRDIQAMTAARQAATALSEAERAYDVARLKLIDVAKRVVG